MDLLNTIMGIVQKFATIGGGLWAVWGVIILAGALKDKNGPEMKSGIWQIVGGCMIIAAVTLFSSVVSG